MISVDDIADDGIIIYDCETDGVDAPYCQLEMVSYQLGLRNEPRLVDLGDRGDCQRLRELLSNPRILKVSYNGINFDDIVLKRYGFYVEPKGRHDMFLALKTVAPNLPSYGLKFASWYYFGDWHEPQRRLNAWLSRHNAFIHLLKDKLSMYQAPKEILGVYCQHDVRQTANIFRMIWEIVQRPEHWKVYNEMELAMGEPLHEMVLTAGEWLDIADIDERIKELTLEREELKEKVTELSNGRIQNAGSALQVSSYLSKQDNIELKLSEAGNYQLRKDELVELMPTNPIAKCVFEIRDLGKVIQHYQNYLNAAIHENARKGTLWEGKGPRPLDYRLSISKAAHRFAHGGNGDEAIPKNYSVSSAQTRRFQSSTHLGTSGSQMSRINFQNQNKRTKLIQLVPKGWLGCWIDSRQIENVVHIWASKDSVRREAYEADADWNEYVWLTNQVLGTEYTRKDLEEIPSPVNPRWSMYKTYKTCKLAMNFFMGLAKFAKTTGLDEDKAHRLFAQVHKACPALRGIIGILKKQMKEKGFISDPFGHIYKSGNEQKMVVYLVQGCGTGSVPKAMTIANYWTLHSLDSIQPKCYPCIFDRWRQRFSYGVIAGTTHDECAFRISLGLPTKTIIRLIRECLYNMEEKFSPLFDDIPLRAQLAVSITNAGEMLELNHHADNFEERLINEFLKPAKTDLQLLR